MGTIRNHLEYRFRLLLDQQGKGILLRHLCLVFSFVGIIFSTFSRDNILRAGLVLRIVTGKQLSDPKGWLILYTSS